MRAYRLVVALVLCCALAPCARRPRGVWSIGIYTGETPLGLAAPPQVRNPVLTAEDITDVRASYVADPFLLHVERSWFLFFEILEAHVSRGCIGLATSPDGFTWSYRRVVLREPFHLSYPYVFAWQGSYYMIPESRAASAVRLYKAERFPDRWVFEATLLDGRYADASLVRHDDLWWLFALRGSDTLTLHVSRALQGPWREHPESPLVRGDKHIARPGGRVLAVDGALIRLAQDDAPTYGRQLRALRIETLSVTRYAERELPQSPFLTASGQGWNADGMHHADIQHLPDGSWLAAVDGLRRARAGD
jgi:hypothetical protein